MGTRLNSVAALVLASVLPGAASAGAPARVLRVCADPNNLPFSNDRGEGFENRLAELLAKELGAKVEYTWWAQRRGFTRNTLKERACDAWLGVPAGYERALTTKPYYRSRYVALSRADRKLDIRSFDDPRLRSLKLGVQLVGEDYANTPPGNALAKRGLVPNVRGYTLYGDYSEPNPPASIVEAVATGEVDVAFVWGPLAGYFARRARVPLALTPLAADDDGPDVPLAFDISVGVRKGDKALRDELERALERRHTEVAALLAEFAMVPVRPAKGRGR